MNDTERLDFTERARLVLSLAQEEALHFQHESIGTEHLLLGLIREGEGVAAKVLANLGVDLNKARSTVESIMGRGDHIVLGEIGLTPGAKAAIKLAEVCAHRLNHHSLGTEHLLLSLIHEENRVGAGVLLSLGVSLAQVHKLTLEMLGFRVIEQSGCE